MDLTNTYPSDTYKRLIQFGGVTNAGVTSSLQNLQDGSGALLPISVSSTGVWMTGEQCIRGFLVMGGGGGSPRGEITLGSGVLFFYTPSASFLGTSFTNGEFVGFTPPSATTTVLAPFRRICSGAWNIEQLGVSGSVRFANFGAGTAIFDANGNISSSSDERLKNIKDNYHSGFTSLSGIEPIIYSWNEFSNLETEHDYIGFSAQNVQKFLPEAVFFSPNGYLSIQDRPLLAACINSIKELKEENNKLKSRIEKLEEILTI